VIVTLFAAVSLLAGGSAATTVALERPSNPWAEPARDVLVQSCGSCHRPGLATSNPRALAVFNLHDTVWYAAMTDDQVRELQRRIDDSSKIEDADKQIVTAFVNCRLDGACGTVRAEESP